MNTLRARRAAATVLLAAGTVLLVPAPAHAICMTDDKGQQVCGDSGSGPEAGQPGAYNGTSGINNGTPGQLGPDGRPMTAATQPAWMAPGYTPPPAPEPPPVTAPPAPKYDTTPKTGPVFEAPAGSGPGAKNYVPGSDNAPPPGNPGTQAADTSENGTGSAADAPATDEAATDAAKATSEATTGAGTSATMTARPTREPVESSKAPAETSPSVRQASATERFNPVPLLAALVGLLIAGAVVFFVPGVRAAAAGIFNRGSH